MNRRTTGQRLEKKAGQNILKKKWKREKKQWQEVLGQRQEHKFTAVWKGHRCLERGRSEETCMCVSACADREGGGGVRLLGV